MKIFLKIFFLFLLVFSSLVLRQGLSNQGRPHTHDHPVSTSPVLRLEAHVITDFLFLNINSEMFMNFFLEFTLN